eukprot:Clim_evm124s157 gene=Clim_evmTU124s157
MVAAANDPAVEEDVNAEFSVGDQMIFTPLGSGQEVGRSCHILSFKGKTIMLDCGIHPGMNGIAAMPYFDEVDPAKVDLVLITHFHLDHMASLPYFMEKTTFKGRVFMTHPTKAIYKWLLADYVRVSNISAENQLYTEKDLDRSLERIEAINFHEEVEAAGVRFCAFNAGHVLGAAMFMIEIAGVKILYTGDYSREEDRHLMAAEIPTGKPDVLIVEATYGVQIHEPRLDREHRFTGTVHDIIQRGGRCLMPVFALGRAQELLLILDEYWEQHPELQNVPIYYASALAKKCMAVYQTYINMMNARIRRQFATSNPFIFKHISSLRGMDSFDDVGPAVVMASPGMLQSGMSRDLFEMWCSDRNNGVIVAGYAVEGTLAKHIMTQPPEIVSLLGNKLPLRMSVTTVSFSAHADFPQTSQFIEELLPNHVILVHGEQNEMRRLKQALVRKYDERTDVKMAVYNPKNTDAVKLYFRGEKLAKAIGRIAETAPKHGQHLSGLLVNQGFNYRLMEPSDLREFSDFTTSEIYQRLAIPCKAQFQLITDYLETMYGNVEQIGKEHLQVFGILDIARNSDDSVKLEWVSNAVNDMIADSVAAVILQLESHPSMVKLVHQPCQHHHHVETKEPLKKKAKKETASSSLEPAMKAKILSVLESKYGAIHRKKKGKSETLTLEIDDMSATIDGSTLEVTDGNNDPFEKAIKQTILETKKFLADARV